MAGARSSKSMTTACSAPLGAAGCSRACTIALHAPGKYTYYIGDLVADDTTAAQVLACAQLHAYSTDGNMQRKERPERLRSGILARLPPLATIDPAGP